MVTEIDYPAWIIMAVGIYSLAAGIGELRNPGFWASMIADLERISAIRFITGLFLIAIGTAMYLIGPWGSDDWMRIAVKFIGGWMVIEGAIFLAFGDFMIAFSKRMMAIVNRFWAYLAVLIGLAAIIVAELRISSVF